MNEAFRVSSSFRYVSLESSYAYLMMMMMCGKIICRPLKRSNFRNHKEKWRKKKKKKKKALIMTLIDFKCTKREDDVLNHRSITCLLPCDIFSVHAARGGEIFLLCRSLISYHQV